MVADAKNLAANPEFKSLVDMLEEFLARGCVLRKDSIDVIHKACGSQGARAQDTQDRGPHPHRAG